jgi:hypothetical protein
MGKTTHPLPSSLPLLENIVAVVVDGADLEVAADFNADADAEC